MKSETREVLSDYYKAVGVSEMPRRKKKEFKRSCRKQAKYFENWFIGVQRWAQTQPVPHMATLYPLVGTAAALIERFNLKDPTETDGSFRLTFDGGITQES